MCFANTVFYNFPSHPSGNYAPALSTTVFETGTFSNCAFRVVGNVNLKYGDVQEKSGPTVAGTPFPNESTGRANGCIVIDQRSDRTTVPYAGDHAYFTPTVEDVGIYDCGFVDYSNGNFKPRKDSVLRDAGFALDWMDKKSVDLGSAAYAYSRSADYGVKPLTTGVNRRVRGANCDIGPSEYNETPGLMLLLK